jgi:hypothetical protein
MDAQMRSMRETHDKMMAARTPEERQALLAQHTKVMQDGMAMMEQTRSTKPGNGMGDGMSMSPEMMDKRMDMMKTVMQMMMDRGVARTNAVK